MENKIDLSIKRVARYFHLGLWNGATMFCLRIRIVKNRLLCYF